MNLLEILTPECVRAPLESADKHAAIVELVDLLAAAGKVSDAGALKDAVWTREQTRTTGIGHGLAIPHGKSDTMNDLALAIGKPALPMDFEAIDGQPVQLIVLLASPPDRTSDHIQALAQISRLVSMESFRSELYGADSGEAIYELLKTQGK
ncbi:MAG: PTS sugar transporter subunit IIA [Phycisphaerales bacterium]